MSGLLFTILSVTTMGLTAAAAGFLVAIVFKYKLSKMYDIGWRAELVVLIVAVLALLVFIFAIYASCCGKRCAKCLLSLLFVVFFVLFLAFGCAVVLELDWIEYTACIQVWKRKGPEADELRNGIEKALQCKCWKDKEAHDICYTYERKEYTKNCYDVLHPWWKVIYIVAFAFSGLLFIGVMCAWGYVCCRSSGRKQDGIMYGSYHSYD
jgi:lysylphosphatidylglycerol synthetase-like protein (DUF2156 family)